MHYRFCFLCFSCYLLLLSTQFYLGTSLGWYLNSTVGYLPRLLYTTLQYRYTTNSTTTTVPWQLLIDLFFFYYLFTFVPRQGTCVDLFENLTVVKKIRIKSFQKMKLIV